MPNLQLASYANLALYAAMIVLALAMLTFAVYVAFAERPRLRGRAASATAAATAGAAGEPTDEAGADRSESELVGASTGPARSAATGGGLDAPARDSGVGRRMALAGDDAGTGDDAAVATAGSTRASVGETHDAVTAAAASTRRPRAPFAARSGQTAMSLTWMTLMLLIVSVVARGVAVGRVPVANMSEFAVFGSMLALALYLVLAMRRPLKWLGLFVVTPVLLVLGLALTVWYSPAAELLPSLQSLWLAIHVPIATLAVALFTVAFSVLLLELARERHDARVASGHTRASFIDTLPGAGTLDRIAYGLHIVAFPLWTFSVIAGAIWAQQAWGSYWNWDPKETWTFVIWVVYAAYLHARATSGWSRRTANILACLGYLAIIVNFAVVNVYFVGQHSYSGL